LSSTLGLDLARRLLTAILVLPGLLAALLLGPSSLAVAVVAGAVLLGMVEFLGLLEAARLRPLRWSGFLLAAGIFFQVASPTPSRPSILPAGVLLLLGEMLLRNQDLTGAVGSASATLLGAAYLGILGGCIASLRVLPPAEAGPGRLLLLLAVVMLSDTAAYFTGRRFGKQPLAPTLSPHKTVEGVLGGLVGGMVGALGARWFLPLPFLDALVLGVLVSLLGVLGDLFESLLKRWAGAKDSGTLFPGHGGMLDRLDSLLFGAPVLYYYFLYWR